MTFKPRATMLPDAFSNTVSGTTANAYATGLDWRSCAGWNSKTVVVANTGDTNSLTYKILLYANLGGESYTYNDNGMEEFTVSADDTDMVNLNYAYDRVIVQVKSAVSGSSTSYQLDAIGNKGGAA